MENSFKKDILRELQKGKGRILLHDEVEERPGVFSIIPIWEVVSDEEIMTPRDVFELVIRQGYRVRVSASQKEVVKNILTWYYLWRSTTVALQL